MIAGFVIGGTGTKQVLIRAVGPGLSPFGVTGVLSDPVLTVYDSTGTAIVSNDGWASADASVFAAVGAFALTPGSNDSAVVATFNPGAYTAIISSNDNSVGNALIEVYDVAGNAQLINLSTRLQLAAGATAAAGFVVGPGTGTRTFLVRGIGPGLGRFGLSNLLADPQLVLRNQAGATLATAQSDAANATLSLVATEAGAFAANASDAALLTTLSPGNYTAQVSSLSGQGAGTAMIELYDVTALPGVPSSAGGSPVFYLAKLAPSSAATGSEASGYATILYNPSTGTGTVNVQFSNLSSAEVVAHLELGTPGSGTVLLGLTPGQVGSETWSIGPSGQYSAAQVVAALQSGQVFVEIDSANYPAGELFGSFVAAAASQTFVAPAAPPALPVGALTQPDQNSAARFLAQATFGPRTGDLATVVNRGISGWISDQMALPASSQLAATRADATAFPPPQTGLPSDQNYLAVTPAARQAAWWNLALTAPDQLRQRVAFALSEILVVSEQDTVLRGQPEALAHYYDLLAGDAFGNFRQLLNDVTLSPVMATYLTYIQNQPGNATTGTSPDENYAREVQQLFTVGLVRLQPDGTILLGSSAAPVPTYNQATVSQTAKVFTGWSFANVGGNFAAQPPDTGPTGAADSSGWLNPIVAYENYHDESAKAVIDGTIPPGQTAEQDLAAMLDQLFNDANTGPFFCRQLIQRLVTSNPSPGYVYRVAQVFANDGTGVRGNLAAVVTAILTDYEARSATAMANVGFGKIKEPLIRVTAFFRALNASAPNGRYLDSYYNDPRGGYDPSSLLAIPEFFLGEGALQSPNVFNFFSPDYTVPGPVAAAGLVAPEMALATDSYSLNLMNEFSYYLFRDVTTLPAPGGGLASPFLVLDYSAFLPLAANSSALLDALNLAFCGGNLSAGTRAQITSALAALSPNTSASERVASAVFWVVCSADSARQQ
jgi:uncharacterized protein (DUF1800 family)